MCSKDSIPLIILLFCSWIWSNAIRKKGRFVLAKLKNPLSICWQTSGWVVGKDMKSNTWIVNHLAKLYGLTQKTTLKDSLMIADISENYLLWLSKQIPISQCGDLLPSSNSDPYCLKAIFLLATSMGQELSHRLLLHQQTFDTKSKV